MTPRKSGDVDIYPSFLTVKEVLGYKFADVKDLFTDKQKPDGSIAFRTPVSYLFIYCSRFYFNDHIS